MIEYCLDAGKHCSEIIINANNLYSGRALRGIQRVLYMQLMVEHAGVSFRHAVPLCDAPRQTFAQHTEWRLY